MMWRVIAALLLLLTPVRAEYISGTGGGGGSGSGTVTSISAGCGSTTGGSAITTSGTIATTEAVNLQTGANYAILSTDCGKLVNLSNGSAQTPTIAVATTTGFGAGTYWDVCNVAAGTQTITPTTSTIGGNATQALTTGQCIRIVSDGTNYQISGTGLGLSPPVTLVETVGASDLTLTGATQTASHPVLNITQIWNNAGVAFTGIKANFTATSDNNNSLLIDLQRSGASKFRVDEFGNAVIASSLNMSSGNITNMSAANGIQWSNNAYLTSGGAANLQIGSADAAAPIAQTLQVQSVVTGTTNTAGANFTINGSRGTGTGAGGSIIFQTAPVGTTGTAQNALIADLTLTANGQIEIGPAGKSASTIFGTTGYNLWQPTGTDTDTASSGTIALTYVNSFGARTLAASSATTLTAVAGAFFDVPTNGTNVTFTNPGFPAIFNSASFGPMLGLAAPTNTSGYRAYAFVNAGGTTLKFQRWLNNFAGATSSLFHFDNTITTDTMTLDTTMVLGAGAAVTDATKTDATLCRDTTSGQLYFGSGTAGICLGTSSLRFKHDVSQLDAGLNEIMGLQPIQYHLNSDRGDSDKLLYGFSAEQGSTALPRLVGLDADGRPNTFDYLGVVPVLVRALQQQQREIEELKQRLH